MVDKAALNLTLNPADDLQVSMRDMSAVIPPCSNLRELDWFVYWEHQLIECFFNKSSITAGFSHAKIMTYRNYMGMLRFISALVLL
jgi:hypothetical protein